MHDAIRFALLGLGGAAVYAFLALGVVLIYRTSGVLNFSQGALAVLGVYIFVELRDKDGWPTAAAMCTAIALLAVLGAAIYWLVIRLLTNSPPLTKVFATLGIMTVVQAAAVLRYGQVPISTKPILPSRIVTFSKGISIPEDRLWLFGIAVLLTVLLAAQGRFTVWGLASRGLAQSERSVAALGWSPDLLSTISWAIGAGLAAVAGIMIVPLTGLQATTLTQLLIVALAAAMVGGFKFYTLTLLGAAAMGIGQSEIARYVSTQGAGDALPFIAIIVVLVVMGRSLPLRSHLVDRMPEIGSGRVRWVVVVPLVIGFGIVMRQTMSIEVLNAMIVSFSVALLLLSLVVLTGYAGQLSLAQYALAGVGALIAGRLAAGHGWPLEAAIPVGVVGSSVVGVLFAIPALRTRGVNLAVVTLGLGSAIYSVVFSNAKYTGGTNGTSPGPQTIFGINIDPLRHTFAYTAFTMLTFVIACILVCNLRRSPAGRRLIAIRTNERAAASLGINVLSTKTYAFGIASAIAGLAGIVIAFSGYSIDYTQFNPLASVNAVVLIVVGSIAFAIGPLFGTTLALGAVGTVITRHIFGNGFAEWLVFLGGVFVIVLLIQNPDGMASYNVRWAQLIWAKVGGPKRCPLAFEHGRSITASSNLNKFGQSGAEAIRQEPSGRWLAGPVGRRGGRRRCRPDHSIWRDRRTDRTEWRRKDDLHRCSLRLRASDNRSG